MPSSSPPRQRRRSGSPSKTRGGGASGGLTAAATAAAESKRSKLITRTVWGLVMFFYLLFVLYRGHGLVCLNVFLAQCEIFREMVNVRYNNRKKEVPWFRSLQWAWFAVAVIYFYGGPMIKGISLTSNVDWRWYEAQHKKVAFLVYSFVFVVTVLAMKKGEYRYQMNQLAWTILTLIMVVAQMQVRFWLTLLPPFSLFRLILSLSSHVFSHISRVFCAPVGHSQLVPRPDLVCRPDDARRHQ